MLRCMNIACRAEATHSVKALVPLECTCDKLEMFCSLRLCLAHAQRVSRLSQVLPLEAQENLCDWLQQTGTPFGPDFNHAELIIIPIDDPAMLMQELRYATIH